MLFFSSFRFSQMTSISVPTTISVSLFPPHLFVSHCLSLETPSRRKLLRCEGMNKPKTKMVVSNLNIFPQLRQLVSPLAPQTTLAARLTSETRQALGSAMITSGVINKINTLTVANGLNSTRAPYVI